ncbi:MAG: S8 family serine peptidase [Desulfobulbaceae bacterium]|nr:S8 family serine peptidase [Desulfobulbaceae bacterium]
MMEKSWIISAGLLVIAGVAATASQAGIIHPDLGARLQNLLPEDEVSVIVTLTDQVDLRQFKDRDRKVRRAGINRALRARAEKTQGPLKKFLHNTNVRKFKPFWIFNGMAVTLRADQVDELARRPDVQSVRLDGVLTLPEPSPSQTGTPEWNLNAINAPALWELGYTGKGIVIASMDTGVDYLHPDIKPKWRGGSNSWFDPFEEHPDTPVDNAGEYSGHGTGVMGIIVGGDAGGTAIGVAPDAQWIAVKIFNDSGEAPYSEIHEGFQWLLDPDGDPDTDDLPDVVNNSWGLPDKLNECFDDDEPFQFDIQALKTAGVAVVFSGGNTGGIEDSDPKSIPPANYPESLAVGAVDEYLIAADFSARGPSACDDSIFPEIVAPGVNVRSADLTYGTVLNSYRDFSGTSFAAPHVSGAMALLLQADPELSVDVLEGLIKDSAADPGNPGPDNTYGYGMLDVAAAVYNLFDFHSLTINVTGKGSVSSNPPGIYCPGDCEKELIAGTVVTLTAVPASGSSFTGWTGDCTGQEKVCEIAVDRVKNVTAGFYSFPWELFIPIIKEPNHQ